MKRLTKDDRQTIEKMHSAGYLAREIAASVGVSTATVCRELARGYTGELTAERRPVYSAAVAEGIVRANARRRGRSKKAV
jgi:IS30 family transposase